MVSRHLDLVGNEGSVGCLSLVALLLPLLLLLLL
jgi:hypothetical protein